LLQVLSVLDPVEITETKKKRGNMQGERPGAAHGSTWEGGKKGEKRASSNVSRALSLSRIEKLAKKSIFGRKEKGGKKKEIDLSIHV